MLFVGQRAFDGLTVATVQPLSHVVTCDSAWGIDEFAREISFRSLEKEGHRRSKWTSADISKLTQLVVQCLNQLNSRTLLPYAASPELEAIARNHSVRILAPPSRIQRFHDDKRNNVRLFQDLNLPTFSRITAMASDITLKELNEKLGPDVIARCPFGSTGSGVSRIITEQDINKLRATCSDIPILFEQFLEGTPINMNAVAFNKCTVTYSPSIQVIGAPECSDVTFGFCGSDFSAIRLLGEEVSVECRRQTQLIGTALSRQGIRGLFGVDFLVSKHDGRIYPLEVNLRFQNSTALLNLMMKNEPSLSPARMHCRSFDACQSPVVDITTPQSALNQLILYAEQDGNESFVTSTPCDGIYDAQTMKWTTNQDVTQPSITPNSFVIAGAPQLSTSLAPGATLLKIVTGNTVLNNDGRSITSHWSKIAAYFRSQVCLNTPSRIDKR